MADSGCSHFKPLSARTALRRRFARALGALGISLVVLSAPAQPGVMVGVGKNQSGQLGGPIGSSITVPMQIASGVRQIVATGYGSILLMQDGRVLAAGWNLAGQFLDYVPQTPTYIRELTEIWPHAVYIAGDYNVTLVIDQSGRLYGRGYNFAGRLASPVEDTRLGWTLMDTNVVKASTHNSLSLWIKSDGTLWGVGSNDAGQLGVESVKIKTSVPVKIADGVSEAISGSSGALFIKQDGSLWGMGSNQAQRLGTDLEAYVRTPVQVADNVISAAMSGLAVYYVNAHGELWENWSGDSVLKKGGSRTTLLAHNVRAVSAETRHLLYFDHNHNVWTLGDNTRGQLGGTEPFHATPIWIANEAQMLQTSSTHSLVLKFNGSVWGAGDDSYGQLASVNTAKNVLGVRSFSQVKALAAGGAQTAFIRENGALWTAGFDDYGSRGLGEIYVAQRPPTPLDQHVQSVATSGTQTLWVRANGELWGTGANGNGQLGIPTSPWNILPFQIGTGFRSVRTAKKFSYFQKSDGSLWSSGLNTLGTLGLGSPGNTSTMQKVTDAVIAYDVGAQHAAWVDPTGQLWGAGDATPGTLGPGRDGANPTPVLIAQDVRQVACGSENTYFLKADRTLWGLGGNPSGQLGASAATSRNDTPILLATEVVEVDAEGNNVAWINTTGELWGLGQNEFGQLGTFDSPSLNTPQKLASQVHHVAVGDQHIVYTQVPETYLTNLSTRVKIPDTGEGRLVAGFVIGGTEPLTALIRAVGPGLAGFGVEDTMPNPSLQIFNSAGTLIQTNDDWAAGSAGQTAEISTVAAELGAFGLAAGSQDAALLATLPPGAYTAQIVRGDAPGGAVLLEVYNRQPRSWKSRLINLSVRTDAGSGADTLTAGFVIEGARDQPLLVRAVGPSLAPFGVTGYLPDPQLVILKGSTEVAANDNWSGDSEVSAQSADLGAFPLSENTSADAASVVDLAPGAYTTQVRTKGDETGNTLVEIYAIDN